MTEDFSEEHHSSGAEFTATTERAVVDDAPPTGTRMSEEMLAALDAELDLEHRLVELNANEQVNKAVLDEALFMYHGMLSGSGRAGKFTSFLRDRLGWSPERTYDKAMRRIARHMHRAGLIDSDEYQKRSGNGPRSTPLRCDSMPSNDGRPQPPPLTQSITTEADPSAPSLSSPSFTSEEVEADQTALASRRGSFHRAILHRAVMHEAEYYWVQSAARAQARRHGTKNYSDTLCRVWLCGTKKAEPGDEWGETLDEIFFEVGRNPACIFYPDPSIRDDWDEPFDADESAAEVHAEGIAESPAASPDDWLSAETYTYSDTPSSAAHAFPDEITLDDFDDALAF